MKTRTPAMPYSNITHKPRKEKKVPVKHDTEWRRCTKFYCVKVKANACCKLCPLMPICEIRCDNNNAKRNCLTNIMKSQKDSIVIGRGETQDGLE